jgi:hypothetical protein
MPIRIESYIARGLEVWTQEKSGRRFVARCASKAMAARVVRLLNAELISARDTAEVLDEREA